MVGRLNLCSLYEGLSIIDLLPNVPLALVNWRFPDADSSVWPVIRIKATSSASTWSK